MYLFLKSKDKPSCAQELNFSWIKLILPIPKQRFLDLNLSISNGTVSTKIYDKRGDFDFDIVNFPFLDGDVPRRTSYGVYIFQLIRFARASSSVSDFNYRDKALTAKLLRQGYRYNKLRNTFSKFYRRHSGLVEKYNVSLKKLMQHGISDWLIDWLIYGASAQKRICRAETIGWWRMRLS